MTETKSHVVINTTEQRPVLSTSLTHTHAHTPWCPNTAPITL